MGTYTKPRLTMRQIRLGAWMRDPRSDELPKHEAIDWRHAMWTAERLVALTGIYPEGPSGRRACLADLHALVTHGDVERVGITSSGNTTGWMVAFDFG